MKPTRPITLTIAALGGQGGGVVTDWLVAAARRAGYIAQATSVPGVAQRTGATIYYLEFFPRAALGPDGREPIMALMPSPGDVDIVVASELLEAGRAINRGIVTKDRTTLIASTHRDYTIGEKIAMGDGRASTSDLLEAARAAASRLVAFDMAAVADSSGGRISAVIFGAIAGSDVLPWPVDDYREAIRESGIGVEPSLAAFEVARQSAIAAGASAAGVSAAGKDAPVTPAQRADALPEALRKRVRDGFAPKLHDLLLRAAVRLVDYQDAAYASLFLDRVAEVAALEPRDGPAATFRLVESTARSLALWMGFEDVMRVAQVKTRAGRAERIRHEVRASPGELLRVNEFVKPRVEEICGTLPAGVGSRLLASRGAHRLLARFTEGRQISTSTIGGFLVLRTLAGLRRVRRATLRYAVENERIEAWLGQLRSAAPRDYELAVELAECQNLVKGYGDTHARGWRSFERISAAVPALQSGGRAAERVRALREAALADDSGSTLERKLAEFGAGSAA
jgi:indolepyruvate ferredoxin oxidoreductase beta subunit